MLCCACSFDMKVAYRQRVQGLDALMAALAVWNGGVIVISHDERFITSVSKEVCYVSFGKNNQPDMPNERVALGLRRRHGV